MAKTYRLSELAVKLDTYPQDVLLMITRHKLVHIKESDTTANFHRYSEEDLKVLQRFVELREYMAPRDAVERIKFEDAGLVSQTWNALTGLLAKGKKEEKRKQLVQLLNNLGVSEFDINLAVMFYIEKKSILECRALFKISAPVFKAKLDAVKHKIGDQLLSNL